MGEKKREETLSLSPQPAQSLSPTHNWPLGRSGLVRGHEDGVRKDPGAGNNGPAVLLLSFPGAASRPLLPRVHSRGRGAGRVGRVALGSGGDEGPVSRGRRRRRRRRSGLGSSGSSGGRRRLCRGLLLASTLALGVPLVQHPAPLADLPVEGALGAGLADVRGHGVDRDEPAVEEAALVAVSGVWKGEVR